MRFCELTESMTVTISDRTIPITLSNAAKRTKEQMVNVKVDAIEQSFKSDPNFYVGPGGEGGIGNRYQRFADFVKDATSIEAPEAAVSKDGVFFFGNGRHRFSYFRDQGAKTIPVAMSKESIKHATKFGYLAW